MSPFWQIILTCSGLMCLVAGGYLLLLLRTWPRVFLNRYPESVRRVVAPLSPRERLLGTGVSLPLLVALVGFPTWAGYRVVVELKGGISDIFWSTYLTWMVFNLFDWLVLDELIIGMGRPEWLRLQGAEHMPLPFDHKEHAMGFVRGSAGGVLISAAITGVLAAWP